MSQRGTVPFWKILQRRGVPGDYRQRRLRRAPSARTNCSQAARDTVESLFAAIERAAELPDLDQPFFDEDLEHLAYRRLLVKRYWVYYTYAEDTFTVRRIFHTTQDTDCYGFEILDD